MALFLALNFWQIADAIGFDFHRIITFRPGNPLGYGDASISEDAHSDFDDDRHVRETNVNLLTAFVSLAWTRFSLQRFHLMRCESRRGRDWLSRV